MKHAARVFLVVALAATTAGTARAQTGPMNQPPPSGNVVLDLNGTPVPHTYQQYTTGLFAATGTSTNISFALRDDPAYLQLDDITVLDVTTGAAVTVVNGGFESGPVGSSTPTGWTYLNLNNASASGFVRNSSALAHSGFNLYYDGSVGAYDTITQAIATTPNDLYNISFWLSENGGSGTFSREASGSTPGIDVVVYAGALPVAAAPEPASLIMIGTGLATLGIAAYRRKRLGRPARAVAC